jgi:MoaA/NifB/PqqE/SkfB family radical SAM enzyme
LNCEFCYLGKLRQSKDVLEISSIKNVLDTYDVRVLDIYGGEITLLEPSYITKLVDELKPYFNNEKIYITSNALSIAKSKWLDYIKDGTIYPSFSYDICRPNNDKIKAAIQEFDGFGLQYSVICLDISDLYYEFLLSLSNMKSFIIKLFSKSKYMDDCEYASYMV